MKKHIKFTGRAIANLRHSDYEFTYVTKDGSTKTRKQIEITFQDLRHTNALKIYEETKDINKVAQALNTSPKIVKSNYLNFSVYFRTLYR